MMGTDFKVNRLAFDVHFFSVTIYKVRKCLMPSVFQTVQKSHVVYFSLKATKLGSLEIHACGDISAKLYFLVYCTFRDTFKVRVQFSKT